ncbi:pilin, partial [Patescibacteria group bacterium]|nr:pilin [Patescibacteria group bacterium]
MLRRRRQDSKQENLFSIGMLISSLLVIFVTGAVSFFVPSVVRAISFDYGLGDTLGFGTADLLETVISIVQWALGLLGLVAVIIIMYGGFIWMTAQGNQDKIEKAKKIIFNGLIGLAIILLSWAIVFFVSS